MDTSLKGENMRYNCICHIVFFVVIFSVHPLFAQSHDLTIEQIMNAPFSSELTAAPVANRVAWVNYVNGIRNIWIAEGADYKVRPLTSYDSDDGQKITNLSWSPNGSTLVYVRGNSANSKGEHPNPNHKPMGTEQNIWAVNVEDTTSQKLGAGSAPTISPKGDLVAYISKKQIWTVTLNGKQEASQLTSIKGSIHSLRWSPDGTRLAFINNRSDHSFVGIYEFVSKTIKYLDPSVDSDTEPTWSPDGKKIAFVRIPTMIDSTFGAAPLRIAEPWSIRIANLQTGNSREIWRATKGRGSVFRGFFRKPLVAKNQIFWAADNQIVFPWEFDGWTHLYSVLTSGEPAILLTPGEFEVEHVSLSPDLSTLIYSSNQGDIDRRHIWKVKVTGGRPLALTSGNGIEWSPLFALDGKTIFFLHSTARKPAHAVIRKATGVERELTQGLIPKDFPFDVLVQPQAVTFATSDGMMIRGQLFLPKKIRPGERYPAIIFLHGGSRQQMLLGWHYRHYYHNAYGFNQYLANQGFIVLSVNYRSGIGYGMEFREALNFGIAGASDYNDVIGAGLYLRTRVDVDSTHIGLWGGSYGGYLTALGLARSSDLFTAGVDLHGVHDWNKELRWEMASYDNIVSEKFKKRAFASSPMASIKNWRSPVFLIHGDDDSSVSFGETVRLVEELRRQNVEFEQLVFPDEGHGFLLHKNWLEAYRQSMRFFKRHLKPTATSGSSTTK